MYSQPLIYTLLKDLWQHLQPKVFWGIMLQASHTYFLPLFFAGPLKLHQVGGGV